MGMTNNYNINIYELLPGLTKVRQVNLLLFLASLLASL